MWKSRRFLGRNNPAFMQFPSSRRFDATSRREDRGDGEMDQVMDDLIMKKRIRNFLFSLTTLLAFGAQGQNLLLNPYFTNGFSGWNGTYGLGTQTVNPA